MVVNMLNKLVIICVHSKCEIMRYKFMTQVMSYATHCNNTLYVYGKYTKSGKSAINKRNKLEMVGFLRLDYLIFRLGLSCVTCPIGLDNVCQMHSIASRMFGHRNAGRNM